MCVAHLEQKALAGKHIPTEQVHVKAWQEAATKSAPLRKWSRQEVSKALNSVPWPYHSRFPSLLPRFVLMIMIRAYTSVLQRENHVRILGL